MITDATILSIIYNFKNPMKCASETLILEFFKEGAWKLKMLKYFITLEIPTFSSEEVKRL